MLHPFRLAAALLIANAPFTLFCSQLWAAEAFILKMEFSRNPIYEGESVTTKFTLYGTPSFIEAEVAKFPEFRGFWTQNHVLRQGPLPLVPEYGEAQLNQALVGSYTITPMIGKRDPQIIPMKMILRSHDFFQNDFNPDSKSSGRHQPKSEGMEIWSDSFPLQVLPLPPVPASMKSKFFGAVGVLTLLVENDVVTFRSDEPFSIRVAARGMANFPDISELGMQWPERAKVVSRRTFSDPTVPPTKIFEYTVVVHGEEPLTLPPMELAVFNPQTKQYSVISGPAIRLEPQPSPPLESLGADAFGTPAAVELPTRTWQRSLWFWALQAVFLLLILGTLFNRWWRHYLSHPSTLWRQHLKTKAQQLDGTLKAGNQSRTLGLLERLLTQANPRATHRQTLEKMKPKWSKAAVEEASWVFKTWDEGFAPPEERPAPAPVSRLRQAVNRILAALAKGRARW